MNRTDLICRSVESITNTTRDPSLVWDMENHVGHLPTNSAAGCLEQQMADFTRALFSVKLRFDWKGTGRSSVNNIRVLLAYRHSVVKDGGVKEQAISYVQALLETETNNKIGERMGMSNCEYIML